MSAVDPYNRKFKNLRVSLLDTCNFECVYCTMGSVEGESDYDHRPQKDHTFFLQRIEKLHQHLNLEVVRLTGGEPLLYRDLPNLIHGITSVGIAEVKLTTNGFLLEKQVHTLKNAGIKSINISLDALDEKIFYQMSKRRKVEKVLKGIDAALAVGLEVKINAVIMKGFNESQILPLLDYAFSRNVTIRFLEVMAMGHLFHLKENYIFSQQEILNTISTTYQLSRIIRKTSATANYWQTNTGKSFGIIANESAPFCTDCNRLRMDSTGNLYGCLSSNNPITFNVTDTEEILLNKFNQAMQQKQTIKFKGSDLSMLEIGG